jgi:hypothetical protein
VKLLTSRLKPGAYLHLATDWHNYAEQMLLILNAETDLANIAQDVQFLTDLPKSYTDLPKEDLKNVLAQIDNKLNKLTVERDSLLAQAIRNDELIKSKENTINALGKEKNIIGLTLETDDLIIEKTDLEKQRETLKK